MDQSEVQIDVIQYKVVKYSTKYSTKWLTTVQNTVKLSDNHSDL